MSNRNQSTWCLDILAKNEPTINPRDLYREGIRTRIHNPSPRPHFETIIRTFNHNAYYGPSTVDFENRIHCFIATAKVIATEQATQIKIKHAELDALEAQAIKQIQAHLNFPTENLWNLKTHEARKKQDDTCLETFKHYKKLLSQVHANTIAILMDVSSKHLAEQLTQELIEKEKQLNAIQGRRSILHRFPLSKNNQTHPFISAHQVTGQMTDSQIRFKNTWEVYSKDSSGHPVSRTSPYYTDPSTIRNTEGLPNFLHCFFADETTREILFEGFRHSSFPPIMVSDCIRREGMTIRNVRQLIRQIALNKIANGEVSGTSIKIDISVMSLLSNHIGENYRQVIGHSHENENAQIQESIRALNYFDGRTLAETFDGKTYTLCTDIYSMTMGCNQFRNMPKTIGRGRSIEKNINNRGFFRHYKAMWDSLSDLAATHDLTDADEILLQTHLNPFSNGERDERIEELKNELNQHYSDLYTFSTEHTNRITSQNGSGSFDNPTQVLTSYQRIIHNIEEAETRLDALYADLNRERKSDWNAHHEQLLALINSLKEESDPNKKTFLNLLQLFYDLQKLYFEKSYKNDEHYFQFQARFLISAYMIGRSPDFFCKSGEDRTGRVNNVIEELLADCNLNDGIIRSFEDPTLAEEIHDLSQRIHSYSASRETTGLNATGSRGLQIHIDQGSNHLRTHVYDLTLAKTAKEMHCFNQALTEKCFQKKQQKKTKSFVELNALSLQDNFNRFPSYIRIITQSSSLLLGNNDIAGKMESHLLSYLTLIQDQRNNPAPDIGRDAILHTLSNNGFIQLVDEIAHMDESLRNQKTHLIKMIRSGHHVILNKKRLETVNFLLKKSNKIRAKSSALRNIKEIINLSQADPNSYGLTERLNEHAPKKITFTWRFPFVTRVPKLLKRPEVLIKELLATIDHNIKQISNTKIFILSQQLDEKLDTLIAALTNLESRINLAKSVEDLSALSRELDEQNLNHTLALNCAENINESITQINEHLSQHRNLSTAISQLCQNSRLPDKTKNKFITKTEKNHQSLLDDVREVTTSQNATLNNRHVSAKTTIDALREIIEKKRETIEKKTKEAKLKSLKPDVTPASNDKDSNTKEGGSDETTWTDTIKNIAWSCSTTLWSYVQSGESDASKPNEPATETIKRNP